MKIDQTLQEGDSQNPHLPKNNTSVLTAAHTRRHRKECGLLFYRACLEYSQSLWLHGKPAQAILQLNKALMADVPSVDLPDRPELPYKALVWYLRHLPDLDLFTGNPVRHFQHLATRMSGPRSELRSWRAWACFHLAQNTLPAETFPRDEKQLREEGVAVPSWEEVLRKVEVLGLSGEVCELLEVASLESF